MSGPAFAPDWLELREHADAAARSADLARTAAPVPAGATTGATTVVRDLGCGTGSIGRWLAARLPGRSAGSCTTTTRSCSPSPPRSFDGATSLVTEPDVTALPAADLDGTSLVTASALLDLLTAREVTTPRRGVR